jgi:hypothetical protein
METEVIKNLITSPINTLVMNRISYMGRRCYVLTDLDGSHRVYSGLTGAMSASSFKGDINNVRLSKWRDKMVNQLGGLEQQQQYIESMADFGTRVHEAIVTIWEQKSFDYDMQGEFARGAFIASAKKLGIDTNEDLLNSQVFDYLKAVSSMMQWIHDEVDEILAVESMAICESLQIATPVDIICRLKGSKDLVSINMKTSSQISEEHLMQASMEMMMWNETYPEYQVAKTGIWRPKDWLEKKGVPTYETKLLKLDEAMANANYIKKRMMLAKDDPNVGYANFNLTKKIFTGKVALGQAPKIQYSSIFED